MSHAFTPELVERKQQSFIFFSSSGPGLPEVEIEFV